MTMVATDLDAEELLDLAAAVRRIADTASDLGDGSSWAPLDDPARQARLMLADSVSALHTAAQALERTSRTARTAQPR